MVWCYGNHRRQKQLCSAHYPAFKLLKCFNFTHPGRQHRLKTKRLQHLLWTESHSMQQSGNAPAAGHAARPPQPCSGFCLPPRHILRALTLCRKNLPRFSIYFHFSCHILQQPGQFQSSESSRLGPHSTLIFWRADTRAEPLTVWALGSHCQIWDSSCIRASVNTPNPQFPHV